MVKQYLSGVNGSDSVMDIVYLNRAIHTSYVEHVCGRN